MTPENKTYHYNKIAEAIAYIEKNHKEQPSLDSIASHINLSSFHFQRLFKEWVGISPKKYLQFISSGYAKALLKNQGKSLFDTAYETGLSGTGRLHDLFIKLEGMTPGEYKNGGINLNINYSFSESPFGDIIIASTDKGICYMAFTDDTENGLKNLKCQFPKANYYQKTDKLQQNALSIFKSGRHEISEIKLHLKGTDFQMKVWEALLSIPQGSLSAYGDIAKKINCHRASRAVGTAIGNNPVAYIIPCHRVIQQSGNIGGYRWNPIRKKAIIGWEISKREQDEN